MKKNKKTAFSLADTLIALSIIGVFLTFTARHITKISVDNSLARFKKANVSIESTISNLINDEAIYGTSSGFKDTTPVTIKKIGQVIGSSNTAKFREAFKYYIQFNQDHIDCQIYGGSSSSGCFKTDYGVVFGIPDTDFISTGTVNTKDVLNRKITAAPITFYTNYKPGQTVKNDAFVAMITHDGKVYYQNTDGIICDKNSKEMQCNLKKYIQATSIKTNRK